MNNYKIEKNIPITQRKGTIKYPFREMKIGDSFSFPKEKRNSVANSISLLKRFENLWFQISKISETECRVWRVEPTKKK